MGDKLVDFAWVVVGLCRFWHEKKNVPKKWPKKWPIFLAIRVTKKKLFYFLKKKKEPYFFLATQFFLLAKNKIWFNTFSCTTFCYLKIKKVYIRVTVGSHLNIDNAHWKISSTTMSGWSSRRGSCFSVLVISFLVVRSWIRWRYISYIKIVNKKNTRFFLQILVKNKRNCG